jgi:hypothetical protein
MEYEEPRMDVNRLVVMTNPVTVSTMKHYEAAMALLIAGRGA